MMRTALTSCLFAALLAPIQIAAALPNNDITRASVSSDGLQANGASDTPSVSADGKAVAFSSSATELAPSDDNSKKDIFIKNRTTGAVTRATDGNADANLPSISKDVGGRFTVFQSKATNLVNTITTGTQHIYRFDKNTSALILVSQYASPGNADSENAVVSSTGQYVAFDSKATNLLPTIETGSNSDIYLFDSSNSSTPITRVSNTPGIAEPNGSSIAPSISANGRYVAFQSVATDLVATADTNGKSDVFLYDKNSSSITLVSKQIASSNTANGNSTSAEVSSDGSYVAFVSDATNLISNSTVAKKGIYLYNVATGAVTLVDRDLTGAKCNGDSTLPSISGNGRYVAFISTCTNLISADTNGSPDLFLYDRNSNQIVARKNVTTLQQQTSGGAGISSISDDGTVIAFESPSTTLVPSDTNKVADIFVTDANCPTDSDGDGTKDCQDECPFDATKTVAGSCGCGSADGDTDGDGTIDCSDGCPYDPASTDSSDCICGTAGSDANGNGVPDCIDPNSSSLPGRAVVSYNKIKKQLYAQLPSQFRNVQYKVELLDLDSTVLKVTCSNRHYTFSNLEVGVYRVRYRAGVAGTFSKSSTSRKIPVRRGRGIRVKPTVVCD